MPQVSKSLPDLLEERETLKAEQSQVEVSLQKTEQQIKKLESLREQLQSEGSRISDRLVGLHREIVEVCNAEMGVSAPVGARPVIKTDGPGSLSDELMPSKEEFNRLVGGGPQKTMRDDVRQAIQNNFVDKTLHEVMPFSSWAQREGELRGTGWKMVNGAFELGKDDRVAVAQIGRDGQKVSLVEGVVSSVEMDGTVSVSVGGASVDVDTKAASSKIYRKK